MTLSVHEWGSKGMNKQRGERRPSRYIRGSRQEGAFNRTVLANTKGFQIYKRRKGFENERAAQWGGGGRRDSMRTSCARRRADMEDDSQ
jgi:dihydroorotate dehydrogenase